MTTVERSYAVPASMEDVWTYLADPAFRASSIGVVEDFETDGEETVWHLGVPIPVVPGTIAVRTRDVERDPPRYVRFVGESSIMTVEGEHELEPTEDGCVVHNRFVVDGRAPGVESYFERHIDEEIDALLEAVGDNVSTD